MEQNQAKTVQRTGRWKLLMVLAVCAAPMIASYLTYYVIKPSGRTNYGALIDPRDRRSHAPRVQHLDDRTSGLRGDVLQDERARHQANMAMLARFRKWGSAARRTGAIVPRWCVA